MSHVIDIIRRIVQQELACQRSSLLGIVTQVFPHTAEDDEHNYEATVRLKHEELELPKVPIAVNHIGIATPPRAGDLVLVQFINGDLNQPVITGRFYHADERPPLHHEDELLFEQKYSDKLNQLRFSADGTIYLQHDVQADNSEAKTRIKIDAEAGNLEIKVGEIKILVSHNTDIEITATDKPIRITCDVLEVNGNVQINGDLTVTGSSGSTTIRSNEITGA